MKRGLAFKLTLGGILVVLIPVLVVGLFSVTRSSKALEETSKMHSLETAWPSSIKMQAGIHRSLPSLGKKGKAKVNEGMAFKAKNVNPEHIIP